LSIPAFNHSALTKRLL